MELNKILVGDCLQGFKKIPDDFFDMTFADPPFNLEKKYSTYKDNLGDDAYLRWCERWISEMIRVTKPSGSIFLHNIPKWLSHYNCMMNGMGVHFRHWIAWDAPSSPMGKSLQPAHYGILYYVKDPDKCKVYELRMPHKRCRTCDVLLKDYGGKKHTIHPFGPLVSDVWTDIHRCKHDRYRDKHPCQLPVHLLERLILLCTDEGDAVLDCFLGSGTTAIAAKRLGRQFLGMELSREYAKLCSRKLKREKIPSRIDDIWVSCYLNRVHTVRECDIWDANAKVFRPEWMRLYENWPDTDDKRRELNRSDLEYRKDVKARIIDVCKKPPKKPKVLPACPPEREGVDT